MIKKNNFHKNMPEGIKASSVYEHSHYDKWNSMLPFGLCFPYFIW